MKTAAEIRARMPPERQAKIAARAKELIAEEMTLQDLRKAKKLTQEQMAAALNIGQDSVSRIEKRSDFLLSTLRTYISAMGGSLDLVVRFPDRAPVILSSLEDVTDAPAPTRSAKRDKPSLVRSTT
jgi:transcriptional regulator with XRE-family HTH domain